MLSTHFSHLLNLKSKNHQRSFDDAGGNYDEQNDTTELEANLNKIFGDVSQKSQREIKDMGKNISVMVGTKKVSLQNFAKLNSIS